MAKAEGSSGNVFLDNAGATATIFALVVLAAFVGAIYNVATSHHAGSSHGGEHQSAPAGAAKH
jgi:hypothetical protein